MSSELPLPPGPKGDPVLGCLRELRRDTLGFFMRVAGEHGDLTSFRVGPQLVALLANPEYVRHVLQEHVRNYDKQTRGFDQVRLLLGNGLLTSEGAFWLRQRRLAQPAFHRQRLAAFACLFTRGAGELAAQWERDARTGDRVDVSGGYMRLTLKLACESLFGADVSAEAATIGEALTIALRFANDRITQLFAVPEMIPTRENRRAAWARETLDRVVRGLIERRRREIAGPRDDLLAMLMDAVDEETGERMSDAQLRDEVMTLMLAGHETTANALSWIAVFLSSHPAVRRRLEEELRTVLGGRAPVLEDVPRLVYTRMVIDETLRVRPPAWIFSRRAIADDAIAGRRIPAGTFVMLSPYVTHHDARLWPNPEGFDPERFEPSRAAEIPRFAYFPFGGGPRQCIGNNFALLEMTLVLATIAQRVRLELLPGARVEEEPTITLRPRGGLTMRARLAQ